MEQWAREQFDGARLGDRRRNNRVVKLAAKMATSAGASLPTLCGGNTSELVAAYRLLNQDDISAAGLQLAHRQACAEIIRKEAALLCVQDSTELDFTGRCVEGLGEIGNGNGAGLVQHGALAVTTEGVVLGVLRQDFHAKIKPPAAETRRLRQARWKESDLWSDTVESLSDLDFGQCRIIHVGDRGSDNYRFLSTCLRHGHGMVIRAKHNRKAQGEQRLWSWLESRPEAFCYDLNIVGGARRKARCAKLSVRFAPVQIPPPVNDPTHSNAPTLDLHAVHVKEENAPEGETPTEWMLLTDEPVIDAPTARKIIKYYQRRWVIEEWHRSLKEGCGIERSQLKSAGAIIRLASLLGIVAVRLLQLRDQARGTQKSNLPPAYMRAIGLLSGRPGEELSAGDCLRLMAHQGGWLGRKNDPPPGWRALWTGWHKIAAMAQMLALAESQKCV